MCHVIHVDFLYSPIFWIPGVINVFSHQSLLVFITGAFLILAYCADKHGSQNFQEVIRDVLGSAAYIITEIIVLIYMFGSSVAYMIIIGDQLESGR